WRLIPFLNAPGKVQMAIDSWLLEKHATGKHPPALRFYTWSPPAISLGYHQRNFPQFWQDLTYEGKELDLVRRPTGGRAVLHQGDLTYMVVTSGIEGKRLEVYEKICQFLIEGWRSLGIELQYGNAGRGYINNPSCFGTATGADLVTIDGYKLIGSAQKRIGKTVLQHGSMRLFPNSTLFEQVFNEPLMPFELPFEENEQKVIEQVIESLIPAAQVCFNIELVSEDFSEAEWQDILNQKTNLICENL
ncbi:MAG: lipoate--protein ligase family protein, partial [Chroococcales cyanobacterium]